MVGDVCSKNWEVEDNKRSYHNSLDNQKYQLQTQLKNNLQNNFFNSIIEARQN